MGEAVITITSGGSPVTTGRVELYSNETGLGGSSQLDGSGQAKFSDIPHGTYVVTVLPPAASPEAVIPPGPDEAAAPPQEQSDIPEKFQRSDASPLQATVGPDLQEYTFDLNE